MKIYLDCPAYFYLCFVCQSPNEAQILLRKIHFKPNAIGQSQTCTHTLTCHCTTKCDQSHDRVTKAGDTFLVPPHPGEW